VLSQDI